MLGPRQESAAAVAGMQGDDAIGGVWEIGCSAARYRQRIPASPTRESHEEQDASASKKSDGSGESGPSQQQARW